MNNEMMYQIFLNSIKNMSDEEMKGALLKVKGMMSESDYQKLVKLIETEKNIFIKQQDEVFKDKVADCCEKLADLKTLYFTNQIKQLPY